MIFRLPEGEPIFPNPELADEDGLLAVGGELSVPWLLLAYRNGIFPWFSEGDPICWYAPHERCVIFPEFVKVSKSMRKLLDAGIFVITINQAFDKVIEYCANVFRRDQPGTWITEEMRHAYKTLHKNGNAMSVEVWQDGRLCGGLYGVRIGKVFCGESMFSLVPNASKAALINLCRSGMFDLIDCQLPNDHLLSMGAEMIGRTEYLKWLSSNSGSH